MLDKYTHMWKVLRKLKNMWTCLGVSGQPSVFRVAVIPHGSIDRQFVMDSETMGGDVVYCVLHSFVYCHCVVVVDYVLYYVLCNYL